MMSYLLSRDIRKFKPSQLWRRGQAKPSKLLIGGGHGSRSTIDKHAPEVSRSITLRPHAPWFTAELRDAKRKRRRCERAYRKSRLVVHEQIYREQCRSYATLLENTKAQYYKSKIEEADQKDLFRLIDGMFHLKPVPIFPSHDNVEQLTEKFSCYFIDKIEGLRQGIARATIPTMSVTIGTFCACSMAEFNEVSLEYVSKTIQKAPSKSCPSDPIPTRTLKACLNETLPTVTNIINSSLSRGVFPNAFKEGRVLPFIKKESLDPEVYSNYRPITNLPFLSKALERIVASQIRDYLTENDLYPSLQSAYRKFHSTETALLRVQNDILRAIDNGNEVLLVLLDLSAAFDTLDHEILINRLSTQYGFTGTVLDWFRSYLNDRSQKVVIGNTESKPQPLTSGVPQGSVLGPLLFSLYFGPLQDVIKAHGLDCMMYADDSQLYIILNPAARQPALLNLELCINDIQAFFLTNKLVCNPTKTEVLHLTSRFTRHPPLSNISIGVNIVSCANKARNLGSVLDRHLTMTSHVNNICRHASLALRNIGRVRKYISQSSTERLVHAFITSKLDYCNSLLYGLPSTELQKLQRIQNTAARLVVKAKRTDHISPILQQLHWLPVSERISFKILLFTYKAMNGYAPSYIVDLLDQYVPSRCLRSASQNLLKFPRSATSTYGDRAFSIAAPRLWNTLPTTVKNAPSVSTFKTLLKTYLFRSIYF
ncbi:hypothetical protein ACROYT_G015732 [Oculina patagonica]